MVLLYRNMDQPQAYICSLASESISLPTLSFQVFTDQWLSVPFVVIKLPLAILHMVIYMFQCYSLKSCHSIFFFNSFSFSSVQSLSRVQLFVIPWTAAHQASLSITNCRRLPKPMSIELVMPFNHLILSSPFPPALNLFYHQGLLKWVRSSHQVPKVLGVSASTSVLPMSTQDWFPLGWTGWVSLQSRGLSRVFSNTTVQKHQFISTQLSL